MKRLYSIILLTVLLSGCDLLGPQYTEEDLVINGVLMHYYFSDTLEGAEQALKDEGITLNPPLKNATWALNTELSSVVKSAMTRHNATYSGTTYGGYIFINRKSGNNYYITSYY